MCRRPCDEQWSERQDGPIDDQTRGQGARLRDPPDHVHGTVDIRHQQQRGRSQASHAGGGHFLGVLDESDQIVAKGDPDIGQNIVEHEVLQLDPQGLKGWKPSQDRQANGQQGHDRQERGITQARRLARPSVIEETQARVAQEAPNSPGLEDEFEPGQPAVKIPIF